MASMAALFFKLPTISHPFHKTHKTQLHSHSNLPGNLKFRQENNNKGHRVSCGLIEPDGGKLVELLVPESKRDEKRRASKLLPRIKLSRVDLEWVHVLSEGWASPLGGFMRQSQFLQTLHFNFLRLDDGSVVNMSVPIVLAIDDFQKQGIGMSRSVALVDSDDSPIAILNE